MTFSREPCLFQHTKELLISLTTAVSQAERIHDDLELSLDVLCSILGLLELVAATQDAKPLLAVMGQVSHVECPTYAVASCRCLITDCVCAKKAHNIASSCKV